MQKCSYCQASWNLNKSAEICPFCGADLREKSPAESIEDIFLIIFQRHGIEAFRSGTILGYLGDYAPKLVKERKLVRVAVESGAYKAICEAEESERKQTFNKYVSVLTDSYFLDERWANKALLWCLSVVSPSLLPGAHPVIAVEHETGTGMTDVENPEIHIGNMKESALLGHDPVRKDNESADDERNNALSQYKCSICGYTVDGFAFKYGDNGERCPICGADRWIGAEGELSKKAVAASSHQKEFFEIQNGTLVKYHGSDKEVWIPDGVIKIGEGAFKNNMQIEKVVIPDGVVEIGMNAFLECGCLASVAIPDSVTKIENAAFSHCASLMSVVIPNSVTAIAAETFACCTSLICVYLPNSLTQIRNFAFGGCVNLESLVIPDGVTRIGVAAFSGCEGLTSVIIPNSVTEIGSEAFRYCRSLTSVIIPNRVREIGSWAFGECSSLKSMAIPNSLVDIGIYVFENCRSLVSVMIPDNVAKIVSDDIFKNTPWRDQMMAHKREKKGFKIQDGTLVKYHGSDKEVWIPTGVVKIGKEAFKENMHVKKVVIPTGTTEIAMDAFWSCSALVSVIIPDSVTKIGQTAFGNCRSLTSVILPNSLIEIGYAAFGNCSSLMSVTIPDNVAKIVADNAFENTPWKDKIMVHKREKARMWREQGLCQYCGGSFNEGFLYKSCVQCGKPKDY